jgi:hypothetical protein
MRHRTPLILALALVLGGPDAARACDPSVATRVAQPSPAQLDAAGLGRLPIAPDAKRVDLVAPPFSNPTNVTNPLFPISALKSAILNGSVEGDPLKIETTLLPGSEVVEWSPGQCVRTLVSQFVAYRNGRIEEVALDHYAQADDGSVWYLGEDVFNYQDGVIADTEGTWLAGNEGPAAMIMPANPKVGDVLRTENVPGLVFEEVTVKQVDKTVPGPFGPVAGALVGTELHDDGTREDKTFAPGYGEFFSAAGKDLEALALAVPTDARQGAAPVELTRLWTGANKVFAARRWGVISAALDDMRAAWRAHRRAAPRRLVAPMDAAVRTLARAVARRAAGRARAAALAVAQATLDLRLPYESPAAIDRARFDLWARQVPVDAAARDLPGLRSDVSTLEWIRDRIAGGLDPVARTRVDTQLVKLRANIGDRDLHAAVRTAAALRGALSLD